MSNQELYQRFSQGLNWNACIYALYKSSTTITTFVLYNYLETRVFSLYGNINSVIFLMLLWLDFGLQKAIPRFALDYAQDKKTFDTFLHNIFIFKIVMLLIFTPVYIFITQEIARSLDLFQTYNTLTYLGALLFLTEGIISVARLIYHAYFLHYVFNTINAATLFIDLILNLLAICFIKNNYSILITLITCKIISNCILLILAWCKMPILYTQITHHQNVDTANLNKQFFVHAFVMYLNNNLKSLTERNFLFPIFTFTFGPTLANMFKVANDGALLFYRIALKTIGTTDTSLFAHTLHMQAKNKTWQIAFTQLITKIATLVIPILGIIYITEHNHQFIQYNPFIFHIFLIITVSLLIELLFSPYERILEVNRNYFLLVCAYTPYIITITLLFLTNIMTYIGMLYSLIIIHAVRLVSTFILVAITHVHYKYYYPFRSVLYITILVSLGVIIITYIVQPIGIIIMLRLIS